jgi:hypothetical protein
LAISFIEVTQALLAGTPVTWKKFGSHAAGNLALTEARQRRLFAFLLAQDTQKVATASEDLFPGLITAWEDKDSDPATDSPNAATAADQKVWRLDRIETSGFGGLTLCGGLPFIFHVNGTNWCLLGRNGSGKTSLASVALWALTGKRIREQEGPVDETGSREPVTNPDGKKLGAWPPFASYPLLPTDLANPVDVWVRLTFRAPDGEEAIAYRHMNCPLIGTPITKAEIDPRLVQASQLMETGLLMPSRMTRIGFRDKSQSLYAAVKALTGLDQLADIADGCGAFGNAGRRFLKYGKENGLDGFVTKFNENVAKAKEKASALEFELPAVLEITSTTIGADLTEAATSASTEAGAHVATLISEIAAGIDTATPQGRTKIRTAVSTARGVLQQGAAGVPIFTAWGALKEAGASAEFQKLPADIEDARAQLTTALVWHARQTEDKKFRLKALAAQFYVPPHDHTDPAHCPVCTSHLKTDEQKALAEELAQLQQDAKQAERTLEDVCREITARLAEHLPAKLKQHAETLAKSNPRDAYQDGVTARFCEAPPFKDILTGAAAAVAKAVSDQHAVILDFTHPEAAVNDQEPMPAQMLRRTMADHERLVALVGWWASNSQQFADAWRALAGHKDSEGTLVPGLIGEQLSTIEKALHKADPLDELAKLLHTAVGAAVSWAPIAAEQARRQAIADALEPLKIMRVLVSAETSQSIDSLSERMKAILTRIHHKERLSYEHTAVEKKEVVIGGSFEPGMHIDATFVANTSWLRAILWAFILALREETIAGLKGNPFPLMVLDDPQTTFDPSNMRMWAQEIGRLAKMPPDASEGVQLFLTTHDRLFHQIMVDHEQVAGKQGLICGASRTSGAAKIVHGGILDRAYQEAHDSQEPAKAREYIRVVRIYCEDLLKFMLRGEGAGIATRNLGELGALLKNLADAHVKPFDRPKFKTLQATISGGGGKPMKIINDTHHKDDDTVGIAQAEQVKEFWDKTLSVQIHDTFRLFDAFESFHGEPRTFPWSENIVEFPNGHRADVKAISLQKTGIAAAAKSDGIAGDGVVTLEEWTEGKPVLLANHEVFQLTAGTLDPVAGIGDAVIVCNHEPVNRRNLVVARVGDRLLARRYNEMDDHPGIAILTGQSVDPTTLVEPVIIAPAKGACRKIVGTVFAARVLPPPPTQAGSEVAAFDDPAAVKGFLEGGRLFEVKGRSAEPIALHGQHLIIAKATTDLAGVKALDGHLIVAVDEAGTRYFKRLRLTKGLCMLESLNPDGQAEGEILSFDGAQGIPRITHALEVVGVLFDMPD